MCAVPRLGSLVLHRSEFHAGNERHEGQRRGLGEPGAYGRLDSRAHGSADLGYPAAGHGSTNVVRAVRRLRVLHRMTADASVRARSAIVLTYDPAEHILDMVEYGRACF